MLRYVNPCLCPNLGACAHGAELQKPELVVVWSFYQIKINQMVAGQAEPDPQKKKNQKQDQRIAT
jgi:hypothetical protein